MTRNLILSTDSYKLSHFLQYPPDAQFVSAYVESRPNGPDEMVQFFGLQAFIMEYLSTPITKADIDEAEEIAQLHGLPFNREGWEYIWREHKGILPLEIQALPEGSVVPRGTPLVQVANTDPKLPWLSTYIETALLRAIWYPSSVASTSATLRMIIDNAAEITSDDVPSAAFKLHDFGARGASSSETAAIGGLAHLINFQGTDTVEALVAGRKYYGCDMAGFSLPASEHSTTISWGEGGEVAAFKNLLDKFGHGLVSVVADSYDLHRAIKSYLGEALKDQILDLEGRLVVRPDSGDPIATPITVIEMLMDIFGYTTNSKGYRVLNEKVRVIQGDGLTPFRVVTLLNALKARKLALDNIAFGMGGGLLQAHSRDDLRFAMKANAIMSAGDTDWRDLQKRPSTDPAKTSKAGRQAVVWSDEDGFKTMREDDLLEGEVNELAVVWRNGEFRRPTTFDKVREAAKLSRDRISAIVFAEEVPQQAAE